MKYTFTVKPQLSELGDMGPGKNVTIIESPDRCD